MKAGRPTSLPEKALGLENGAADISARLEIERPDRPLAAACSGRRW